MSLHYETNKILIYDIFWETLLSGGPLMKKDINIQIGQRVRTARENAHLSRDELAEKLNISTLFLGYIECGQKGMSLTTLKNISQYLGVSTDYLLLGNEGSNISKKNIDILLNSIDDKYLSFLESQLRNTVNLIHEIENLNNDISKK